MTAIDTTLRTHGFTFAPRITRTVEAIISRVATARRRHATRVALEKLSDRELNDIGLTRGDVYTRF
jgi:uncharacterized protein YjiS (DUF1127 family)